jgi:hypothetical protein
LHAPSFVLCRVQPLGHGPTSNHAKAHTSNTGPHNFALRERPRDVVTAPATNASAAGSAKRSHCDIMCCLGVRVAGLR